MKKLTPTIIVVLLCRMGFMKSNFEMFEIPSLFSMIFVLSNYIAYVSVRERVDKPKKEIRK